MHCKSDMVAHSMGFVYALGMTDFLMTKILQDANGYKLRKITGSP